MPAGHPIGASTAAYYVNTVTSLGQPLLAEDEDRERFLTQLERVRAVYQARLYGFAVTATAVHLVVQVRDHQREHDGVVRARWRALATRAVPPAARLRARLSSLAGFMQTLLQRYSREWNQRRGTRGRLWASRYRATLLADDRAVLAASAWLEREHTVIVSATSAAGRTPVTLAAPPLRLGPGEAVFPADEAPPGCVPPAPVDATRWLERFADGVSPASRAAHARALTSGWALGRPESLTAVLAHLGRAGGRGRSRKLRELDDELGLCGVWG
jgi:hypothetical protein